MHTLVALLGILPTFVMMLNTLLPQRAPHLKCKPRRKWSNLYMCLVTTGANKETVFRSTDLMKRLQELDTRITFVVLLDSPSSLTSEELGVEVVRVPPSFAPSHAKYKARALEYFRIQKALAPTDWVLHLGEETAVDEHCVRACIAFMERSRFDIGQGLITYNTVNYWHNPWLTFAEIARFRQDLGPFQATYSWIGIPLWGCHGSFILVSGRAANAVAWSTACVAEDSWFASEAWHRERLSVGFCALSG